MLHWSISFYSIHHSWNFLRKSKIIWYVIELHQS